MRPVFLLNLIVVVTSTGAPKSSVVLNYWSKRSPIFDRTCFNRMKRNFNDELFSVICDICYGPVKQ